MNSLWAKMPYQVFRVTGKDAITFLQGQCTQDIALVNEKTCLYSAFCTAKAKMIALFLLMGDSDGALYLRIHERQAEVAINRLKMFILRADVSIELTEYTVIAVNERLANSICTECNTKVPMPFSLEELVLPSDDSAKTNRYLMAGLPNGYYEIMAPENSDVSIFEKNAPANFDEVEMLRLEAGHFNVLPETNEKIFPQQTILADWQGISYTKGCYVGQEIIARNKYFGRTKKQMVVATINLSDKNTRVDIGDKLYCEERPMGEIIDCHSNGLIIICLAIISTDKQELVTTDKHLPVEITTIATT